MCNNHNSGNLERIDTGDIMKLNNLIYVVTIMVIAVCFLTYPANAESGQLSVDVGTTSTYAPSQTSSSASAVTFSVIKVDTADYNKLQRIIVSSGQLGGISTASTPFSVSTGGTGTVNYDSVTKTITWYFDGSDGITIASSPITLTYADNIFSGITYAGAIYFPQRTASPSSTQPIYIQTPDGASLAIVTYAVNTRATFSNNYSVVYSDVYGGILTNVSITKSTTTVNTKIDIRNATSSKYIEPTFNNVGFSYSYIYDNQLILNMSGASGDYDIQIINSSYPDAPIPPKTLIIDPITGVGIIFDKNEYAIGDIANISWIRTISTPFGYHDYVVLIYPYLTGDVCDFTAMGGTYCGNYIIDSPTNSGNTKVLFDRVGSYEVDFGRCLGWCDSQSIPTVLASDTAIIAAETPSYVFAPGAVGVGQLFNVTYIIGWTPSGTVWLRDYSWDNSTNAYSTTYQPWQVSSEKGIEKNVSILVTKTGKHLLKLCDPLLGCKASTNLIAFFNGSEITTNVTFSNITLDKSSYSYGETMLVKVAVDNYNWSGKQIVVDYFDEDEGLIQNQYYVQEQIESIPLYISDLTFSGSGNAVMRLIGRNASGEYVLATANLSLSNIDSEGYGLSVSNEKCKGDITQIKVIVPAAETGNLSVSADNAKYNKDYIINGTKTISYKYPITGTYYITLRVNNEAKRLIIRNVNDCGIVEPGATYPGMNGTWKSTQDSVVPTCTFWDNCVRGMFSTQGVNDVTRLLFAIFCIVAMMFFGMVVSKGNFGVSVILGFLPYAFFSYLSISTPCGQYMPLWVTIFIALIIGIKMRWFT